ncbi:MAG: DUF2269 family protein [Beijerinckiaceae bacterium]|nr:DUF2269 family protein [Beijerinckiaceae bacterium]
MRKALKVLHSLASCGLIGSLLAYGVLLLWAPQESAQQYADMRRTIAAISDYVLIPSLAIALVTGLLAMMVQRAFQEMRWVWLKALLGLAMFEASLAVVQAKAGAAATLSAQVAAGAAPRESLDAVISSEWTTLIAITVLSVAQVVVGVWRPSLKRRRAAAAAP